MLSVHHSTSINLHRLLTVEAAMIYRISYEIQHIIKVFLSERRSVRGLLENEAVSVPREREEINGA